MKIHLLATTIALLLPGFAVAAATSSDGLKTTTTPAVVAQAPTVPAITTALGTLGAATVPTAAAVPATPPSTATDGLVASIAMPSPRHRVHHRVSRASAAFDARQRSTIAEHIAENSQAPTSARVNGTATNYQFKDGQIFIVYGGLERITSIDLEPGEEVTGPIQAGDTVRWMVATVTSGTGANLQQHIIVKPTDAGAVTNMLIPTNKRVYMLDLRATQDWYMPSVRFSYPAEDWARTNAVAQQQMHTADVVTPIAATSPEALRFDYRMSGRSYNWKPLQVFDDGTHTYIRMPTNLAATDAPALFVMEGSKPLLVNYRIKGTSDKDSGGATYVVDRLFDKAELRVGTSQVVTIRRR